MDITVPIYNSKYEAIKRTGEEVTYSPLNVSLNTKLAFLFVAKNNLKSDALQAVKLDPAVLEAQITVNTNQKEPLVDSKLDLNTNLKEPLVDPKLDRVPDKEIKESTSDARFQDILLMQEAALLSLTPEQFDFLLKYADTLRRQRLFMQKHLECAFCKKNGESVSWYSSHVLKDGRGRVRCPVLRGYRCPCCGATGDRAHTIKYCPESSELDRWSR